MPDIPTALKEAEELVSALKAFEAQGAEAAGPGAHLALLQQVDRMRVALEDPYDLITRHLASTTAYAAAWTMYKIGALSRLPLDGGSVTAAELAEHCNAEVSIITRCMRCLIVTGVIVEPEPDTYAHTPKSMACLPNALGGFLSVCVDANSVELALPDYIKSHKPEDIFDLRKSPTAFHRGKEGMTYYEVISEDPVERAYWNATLQAMDKNMPILNMFPFASLKEQVEKEPDRPFIVDIGGGRGQALLAILGDIGSSYGSKLILQDLPDVIDSLKEEDIPGIEKMAYDVFSGPQPVKSKALSCLISVAERKANRTKMHMFTLCGGSFMTSTVLFASRFSRIPWHPWRLTPGSSSVICWCLRKSTRADHRSFTGSIWPFSALVVKRKRRSSSTRFSTRSGWSSSRSIHLALGLP